MKLSLFIKRLYRWLRRNDHAILSFFFLIVLAVLLINAFHEEYPDEFDNILGGWYMRHGIPIYTGFFTHHGPVAYFLAAIISFISGNSFVAFRVVFALSIFAYLVWSYLYIRRGFGRERSQFYLIFIGVIALAGNYYWLHMLLADSLSAYFLAPVITILLLTSLYKTPFRLRDLVVVSVLVSLTVLSSLTFLYLSLIIYAYAFYLYMRSNNYRLRSRQLLKGLGILAAPYVVFLGYLLVTFSLSEYFYQGWTFNQRYYIYNYPRPEGVVSINPLRFAIVIANNFYNSYFTLLEQVSTFNLNFPLNITFATGTAGFVIYLLLRRRFLLSAVFIGFLIYANARSEPLNSKETDYQSAVYIMIAFIVIPFLLTRIYEEFQTNDKFGKRVIDSVLLFIIGLYSLFSALFLFQKFFNRSFDKYMGRAPLIYDRPEIAPIINRLISVNDPVWIGPFEFKELFYTHGRPASHYHIFIPGMGMSPEIRERMIEEFEQSKPAVVYFQKNFYILGRNPEMYGQFFINYLKDKYVTLAEYKDGETRYKSSLPVTDRVDIETRLYIRKERVNEVLEKLKEANYIREVTE